jgi:hypothetical protein
LDLRRIEVAGWSVVERDAPFRCFPDELKLRNWNDKEQPGNWRKVQAVDGEQQDGTTIEYSVGNVRKN